MKSAPESTDSAGAKSVFWWNHLSLLGRLLNCRVCGVRLLVGCRRVPIFPTVTLSTTADVTDLIGYQRELFADWGPHKIRPQYQDLVIAATARALKDAPKANAHLIGDEVRILDEINVGVAMAVSEGLLVPRVFKNADEKSLLEIAQNIRDLARKAKANKLSIDEMTSGTFFDH
ncbi:MAG: hypothetical protein Ct9H300mP19_16680 [Dehalococcoidia bacterium]|nr:MAG: hypothetical protein Ct9H300mP19_16680 [Dehalococcoidia bacterium]